MCPLGQQLLMALLFIKHTIAFGSIGKKKFASPEKNMFLPDSLVLCSKVSSFGFLCATRLEKIQNLKWKQMLGDPDWLKGVKLVFEN